MPEDPPAEKHVHEPLDFPDKFLWGAATSAHQVEGNNIYNDWWQWEQTLEPHLRSGLADNHYNTYVQDFALAKRLGHTAHRLSLEWSRIEPEEGVFNQDAINHYKAVLQNLKAQGISVCLTIHHFTNPVWFSQKGGWMSRKSPYYFERFVKKIVPEIHQWVDLWITLNEPIGLAYDAYGRGKFPPHVKGKLTVLKAIWHLAQAHKKAYKVIHQETIHTQVGIAHNISSFVPISAHNLLENLSVWFADLVGNHLIYYLTGIKTHDFLGINYYYNKYITLEQDHRIPSLVDITITKKDVSDMGWELRPEGMFNVLMDMADYKKPIYITENGIASTNDDRRVRFLLSYLKEVYHAIQAGVNVRGYFYWSLLDNYEWVEGLNARFGLIEVDYKTQKRYPRPSAYVYKEIIKNNGIPHYLLRLLGHTVKVKDVIKLPHD